MCISKILIIRGIDQISQSSAYSTVITFEEFKDWIKRGIFLKHLFRYQEARLLIYRLDIIPKPFVAAILLRLLSRKMCYFKDTAGHHQVITVRVLLKLFWQMIRDLIKRPILIQRIYRDVEDLSKRYVAKKCGRNLDLSQSPVYLRTDLWFNVRYGGSVGHITGVFNKLDKFSGKPVLLSTDTIPTVRNDLETHLIFPGKMFQDFKELPSLFFNETFEQNARKILDGKKLSFIYQRYSLNNYSGVKLARNYGIPLVLEYNGSEIYMARNWSRLSKYKYEPFSRHIEFLNFRAADLIVVVSRVLKNELMTQGIDAEKILVNPNGVDPDKFKPDIDGSRIRREYGLDGKIVVGFIGTFGRWHGAEVLAKAVKPIVEANRNVHFLYIGDGPIAPEAKRLIIEDKVEDYVAFTGVVPQEKSAEYLAACDIFTSPHVPNPDGTPFFGSPTKLFEYMAMGKAIVASNLEQIGEVLKNEQSAILVTPGNVEELAMGILRLAEDEQLRERLGKKAREGVITNYTWDRNVERVIGKLKSLDGVF